LHWKRTRVWLPINNSLLDFTFLLSELHDQSKLIIDFVFQTYFFIFHFFVVICIVLPFCVFVMNLALARCEKPLRLSFSCIQGRIFDKN
jgi:hypothetical protein